MNMDRRTFMIGSAAALSAQAQTGGTIGTGMIGVGNRGSSLLQGVMQQSDAKVVALCDIKPDRLDKAASAASKDNPKTYKEWKQVIDNKDVKAVFIATPPHLHSEMAIAAIRAGKHVYCEKPIGATAAQVRDLVAVAKKSKVVFVPGQQLRSMKMLKEAVKKIHDGIIGDVIFVKAQRHATADLPHDGPSGDWYFDVTKSGGYLIEQSVHNLDLCNWVIGAHPTRCSGFGATNFYKNEPPGRTIFDCGTLSYDYPKGVKMSFTQMVFHPRTMPNNNQYVYVYGTKGAVDLMGTATMYPLPQGSPAPLAEKVRDNPHQHIVEFYEAITKNGPLPADLKIGASAALTAVMGHDAMTQAKVINWADYRIDL